MGLLGKPTILGNPQILKSSTDLFRYFDIKKKSQVRPPEDVRRI